MAQALGPRSAKDFVLTKEQLALEKYPMPGNYLKHTERSRMLLCKFMKDKCKDLSSSSKMFALDCEMAENYSKQSEAVSICVVDEDLKVIYKTLIKPDCPIKDYRARFTGINAHTLMNVTTTLADVHKFLREQLPDDAILVGQSIKFDLLALKLMHPYIIDTSVVYNTSGDIYNKSKLKDLAKTYLKSTIQSAGVHSAEEDALTAMKLVKLRIEEGPLPGMKPYNSVKKSRELWPLNNIPIFLFQDSDDEDYDECEFANKMYAAMKFYDSDDDSSWPYDYEEIFGPLDDDYYW